MKGSTTKLLKKVNDICEEGTIWKVFFGLFAALLAADLLLPALTGEKPKLWCSILAGAGMSSACYNIRKARRIREEKQNHEHDEEE